MVLVVTLLSIRSQQLRKSAILLWVNFFRLVCGWREGERLDG